LNIFNKDSTFNLANLVTFLNISVGVLAIYFINKHDFFTAIILAWLSGILDILDGKLARKYNLSTEFGVQIDSFSDFISFVIMPSFLLFYALSEKFTSIAQEIIIGLVFITYIILGLKRLVQFNIKAVAGEVNDSFEGVPVPLGAIFFWIFYLIFSYGIIDNVYTIGMLVLIVASTLNSKLKIPHP